MPHLDDFYAWRSRVQEQFVDLKPHQRTTLAEYSFGLILAGCCGLSSVLTHLTLLLSCRWCTLKDRLRDLYREATAQKGSARSELDYTLCFAPLLRWTLGSQKRLALALDPTCLSDRFRVLCVSVLYQGGAIPVAWAVQRASDKGSWNAIWKELLEHLRAAVADDVEVLVLTDRGLESPALFRTIVALGWHPLMRVKAAGKFRPHGWHRGYAMGQFAASVGRRWAGAGVAYPSGNCLPGTLLASWERDQEEPWLILTDLPPAGTDVTWYAWRTWCEQGYRSIKRGQWQWQRTQMKEPRRVARLWVVIALASLWAIDVGGEAETAQLPCVPKTRELSLLKLGLAVLQALRGNRQPMPLPSHRLEQHSWPERKWHSDFLDEHMMLKC
jgi:hypothetical protein